MFKGEYVDDASGEAVSESSLVTVNIKTNSNGESKTLHFSSDTWDEILNDNESLAAAFFSD